MCFGNSTQTSQVGQNTNQTQGTTQNQTTSSTPVINPVVQGAAQSDITNALGMAGSPYVPYTGQRVADFSGLQNQSFTGAANLPQGNPYGPQAAGYFTNYATAPAQSVPMPGTIASAMNPYMNQYVMQALQPQLEQQNQQFASQNKALDSAATESGAFGDARAGVEAANMTQQQDIARQGLIGQAYNNAFNTAIGAGAQDVSNKMSANTTNANLAETALNRLLSGGQALVGTGQSTFQDLLAALGIQNTFGGQQQQQAQAQLNVPYSDYLAAQQWPFLTTQNLNSTLGAAGGQLPYGQTGTGSLTGTTNTTGTGTATVTQPNNAGYGLLGSILPAAMNGGTGGFGNSMLGGLTNSIGSGISSLGTSALAGLGSMLGVAPAELGVMALPLLA